MKPNNSYTLSEQILKAFIFTLFTCCLFYTESAYAIDTSQLSLDKLIDNLGTNIPSLMRLATAFSYVAGLYFMVVGIKEFKHFGESRTMMSQEHGLKKPITYMVIGAFLVYLPTSIATGLYTIGFKPNGLGYIPTTKSAFTNLLTNSLLIIQLIGVISFIRGLIILTHTAGHGGQPGQFARGITHIIGGILCINMYDTVWMIAYTFGLQSVLDQINP